MGFWFLSLNWPQSFAKLVFAVLTGVRLVEPQFWPQILGMQFIVLFVIKWKKKLRNWAWYCKKSPENPWTMSHNVKKHADDEWLFLWFEGLFWINFRLKIPSCSSKLGCKQKCPNLKNIPFVMWSMCFLFRDPSKMLTSQNCQSSHR